MKSFNTKGPCLPGIHYMADTQLHHFKLLIDKAPYITVNRPHQYGTSTTLNLLRNLVEPECAFLPISFESFTSADDKDHQSFCDFIRNQMFEAFKQKRTGLHEISIMSFFRIYDDIKNGHALKRIEEALYIMRIANNLRIVLALDDMDAAKNSESLPFFLNALNQGEHLDFLQSDFKCVILASVSGISSFSCQANPIILPDCFNLSDLFGNELYLSLSPGGILEMLEEYKDDHGLKFDAAQMSSLLTMYTAGYPFLVSKLCSIIHGQVREAGKFADLNAAWTHEGLIVALKILGSDPNAPLNHPLARRFFSEEKLKELLK